MPRCRNSSRAEIWWMTYRDAVGTQRFESCKTSNKKDAEQRLIDRRKEALKDRGPLCEGCP
jgi:hypothetical protein